MWEREGQMYAEEDEWDFKERFGMRYLGATKPRTNEW